MTIRFTAASTSTRIEFYAESMLTFTPRSFSVENVSLYSYDEGDLVNVTCMARHGVEGDYRYGFQGQEMDDEVKGKGNSINYKYRMHDPRVGRFFAVDPLAPKYPQWGPYNFSGNQVVHTFELEGLEPNDELKSSKNIGKEYQAVEKGTSSVYNWTLQESFDSQGNSSLIFEKGAEYTGPTANEALEIADHVYATDRRSHQPGGKNSTIVGYTVTKNIYDESGYIGFKMAVYVREIDGIEFHVVAFAGTDDIADALTDGLQTFGFEEKQYPLAQYAAEVYSGNIGPNQRLSYVGHSLGGGLASAAAFTTGHPATTFNSASINGETKTNLKLNKSADIVNYVVAGDAVTYGQAIVEEFAEGKMITLANPESLMSFNQYAKSIGYSVTWYNETYLRVKYGGYVLDYRINAHMTSTIRDALNNEK